VRDPHRSVDPAESGYPADPAGSADTRLTRLGWGPRVETALADLTACANRADRTDHADGLFPGRVIQVERGGCMVALADADHLAHPGVAVAVGDWVGVRRLDGNTLIVEAVAPRRSQLTRRDPEGRTQVLAANVDLVLVTAPADRLSLARVERETAVAWEGGAEPVVLLTKADLADPGQVGQLRRRLPGIEVVETSAATGVGADQVAALLRPARTGVLLGPSGAGKSSLGNLLLGTERLAVGGVRGGDHRGRHTTTSRHLFPLPGGGVLIDTPGLRSLALTGEDGIAAAFAEIEDLATGCRFADCRHDREPGCAVRAAADSGLLDPDRLANYHKLRKESEYQARRDDPLARAEAERVWKVRAKAARRLNRERGRDR
jgi:ribosome biogenesis GTPase / thiamine phosphate phosphatase